MPNPTRAGLQAAVDAASARVTQRLDAKFSANPGRLPLHPRIGAQRLRSHLDGIAGELFKDLAVIGACASPKALDSLSDRRTLLLLDESLDVVQRHALPARYALVLSVELLALAGLRREAPLCESLLPSIIRALASVAETAGELLGPGGYGLATSLTPATDPVTEGRRRLGRLLAWRRESFANARFEPIAMEALERFMAPGRPVLAGALRSLRGRGSALQDPADVLSCLCDAWPLTALYVRLDGRIVLDQRQVVAAVDRARHRSTRNGCERDARRTAGSVERRLDPRVGAPPVGQRPALPLSERLDEVETALDRIEREDLRDRFLSSLDRIDREILDWRGAGESITWIAARLRLSDVAVGKRLRKLLAAWNQVLASA